jgi:SpoVK/Ycf46/Vps4 family AAA+-type ATPase
MDENPINDELCNLCAIPGGEHDALHNDERKFNVQYTQVDVISSSVYAGTGETYDVQMDTPCNNFALANGMIVHNTGKSLCAKAIAGVLGLPLIKFDVGRVFGSLVGQSEERVRSALKQLEACAPVTVLLDEVDKGLGGAHTSGGDSGVSKRVLGTILTHMQESGAPIYWVFSANRTDGLPPELLRKGRLDEVFCVTVPSSREREQIFDIHLRKRKQDPSKIKCLDKAVEFSEGYVGSEIEAAVAEAVNQAFHTGAKAVTVHDIIQQLNVMKPISVAFKDDFDAMAKWAQNNARMSSTPIEDKASPVQGQVTRRKRVTGGE